MDAEESASDGDNLLGPFLHTGREKPAFMIDWPKTLVSRAVFHGYTSSGMNMLLAPWIHSHFRRIWESALKFSLDFCLNG